MGFLNNVILPNTSNGTPAQPLGTGTFLNNVVLPKDPARAERDAVLQQEADASAREAAKVNSIGGIAKATIADLGHRALNVPIDFAHSLWNTYTQFPEKIAQDIQNGAQDIQTGSQLGIDGKPIQGTVKTLKGFSKAGGRTAADVALAIFSPISAAIGASLNATGGQKLVDQAGQVIADKSGITDLPAFQKFAINHPNAAEDFNRILTLYLSNGEKGTIDPARMVEESKSFANKLIGAAEKTPTEIQGYHGTTPENAASIKQNGFDISKARGGVTEPVAINLTTDQVDALHYANGNAEGIVPVTLKGQNIATFESEADYIKAVESKVGDYTGENATKFLNKYDGVIIKGASPNGGDMLLTTNPKNVSIPPTTKLPVTQVGEAQNAVEISTPNARHADYARSQGYEPYTPADQLPTIKMGAKAPETLPSIQIGDKAGRLVPNDYKYVPIKPDYSQPAVKNGFLDNVVKPETNNAPVDVSKTQSTPSDIQSRPTNADGTRITKAASDISQNLAEKGFSNLSVDEQAKYSPITKADQLARVSSLLDTNIEQAKSAALGKEDIPNGIKPQVLFNAVEAHALETGDINLLRDLANSPIATQLSEAAQTLGSHGFNDNPNSPVEIIKDVQNVRETQVEKSTGKKITELKKTAVEEIKSEIKKVTPKKQNWNDFIESIKCGY